MHACLLAAMMLGGSTEIADGTVLVLENSNKVVMAYTDSPVTHVAVVINVGGNAWVYEATPGQVRQVPLREYVTEVGSVNRSRAKPTTASLLRPRAPYTELQVRRMKRFLDSQVGRRYSVRGYVRGKSGDGVHCSELVAKALKLTGRYSLPPSQTISPTQLVSYLTPSHGEPRRVPIPTRATKQSWSTRAYANWIGLHTWCTWACYESWTFCW